MFTIKKYSDNYEKVWDDFVLNKSINGTFLHTRSFLNYHPKERFEDCSLLFFNKKNNLAALIPACKDPADSQCFFSHKGSTYGGIVIDKKHYNANSLIEIIDLLESYLLDSGFKRLYLKITPNILSSEDPALLEYLLSLNKYKQDSELNTYIDFSNYKDDVISNFNDTKRKHVKRLSKFDLHFFELKQNQEIKDFYELLTLNLKKYNTKPIHSLEEIFSLKEKFIKDNVLFYGVKFKNKIIAAGMLFKFLNVNVIHAQNLSYDPLNLEINAIEYLYYSIIKEAKLKGFRYLSWGISTEDHGKILNTGLLKNKESYGSSYSLNKSFYKEL